jgi:hypothetical protein
VPRYRWPHREGHSAFGGTPGARTLDVPWGCRVRAASKLAAAGIYQTTEFSSGTASGQDCDAEARGVASARHCARCRPPVRRATDAPCVLGERPGKAKCANVSPSRSCPDRRDDRCADRLRLGQPRPDLRLIRPTAGKTPLGACYFWRRPQPDCRRVALAGRFSCPRLWSSDTKVGQHDRTGRPRSI